MSHASTYALCFLFGGFVGFVAVWARRKEARVTRRYEEAIRPYRQALEDDR